MTKIKNVLKAMKIRLMTKLVVRRFDYLYKHNPDFKKAVDYESFISNCIWSSSPQK